MSHISNKIRLGVEWLTSTLWWENVFSEVMDETNSQGRTVLDLSPNRLKEIINWNPLLSDVFFLDYPTWLVRVKTVEESQILKWHFGFLPLVPWVVQRTLFREIMTRNWLTTKTTFVNTMKPWDELVITKKGIEKRDWTPIIHYEESNDFDVDWIDKELEVIDNIGFNSWNYMYGVVVDEFKWKEVKDLEWADVDKYVMQESPFRFVNDARAIFSELWKLNEWDCVIWNFSIPFLFSYRETWLYMDFVSKDIFDEIAAQILSLWASYILSWNLDWDEINNEAKFKTIIYWSNAIRTFKEVPYSAWSKIKCKWIISKINGREITITFSLEDTNWEILQKWEIKWIVWTKKLLKRKK